MPYITPADRNSLNEAPCPKTPGELNYCITRLCLRYLKTNKENYQMYNDVIGALECAKLEMYRRMIAPYENAKMKDNGDLYK